MYTVSGCLENPTWKSLNFHVFRTLHRTQPAWNFARLKPNRNGASQVRNHRAVVCGRCKHGLFSSTYWRIPIDQVRTSKSWIRMLSFGASCTANPLRQGFQPHPSWPNTLLDPFGISCILRVYRSTELIQNFLLLSKINHHYPHGRAFSQPFPSESLTLLECLLDGASRLAQSVEEKRQAALGSLVFFGVLMQRAPRWGL